jgi:drug/metabolite transporter (DMT)-like permease
MAIVLALLAAGANALATVLQRIGIEEAGSTPGVRGGLIKGILRRPVWFAGLGLATVSFLLQAIALSLGDLSTVQPVMVTELLFLLIILGLWFHRTLGWREWIGASGTAIGLGVFLATSSAVGGHDRPQAEDWLLLLGASIGGIVIATLLTRRGPRSWRAAFFGVAGGIAFALTAAFVKTAADQWSRGPWYVLSHWQAYAVAIAGLCGLVISQHALDAGPVAASQSALLIVNPLASIVMGIWLFGDRLRLSGGREIIEAAFLAVMFLSLFVLSHSPLIASSARDERLTPAAGATGTRGTQVPSA